MVLKEHYEGHRARLRERFLKAGGDALADYELLELILYAAHPRGDVKPLAKELLRTFKTFSQVLSADIQDLLKVNGVGNAVVAALKSVQVSVERCLKAEILQRPILKSWPQIVSYCEIMMRDLKYEQLRLLFLDRQNNLIADEVQQNGTVDQATIYTREIVKRALELGASGLIWCTIIQVEIQRLQMQTLKQPFVFEKHQNGLVLKYLIILLLAKENVVL